jgi:hypothetical protein
MTRIPVSAVLALSGALGLVDAGARPLRADSLAGWTSYLAATDRRIARELSSAGGFLVSDFAADAAAARQRVLSGAVLTHRMESVDANGRSIPIAGALIHHWRGAILIPGLTLTDLLSSLQRDVPDTGQEDVLRAAVIERAPDMVKVYLKLRRTKFVTVVFNTEHVVHFRHHGATRASSGSVATKIAELADPGTPQERELPAGQDHGYLWRWNAYWRYEQTPRGVIAECESVSLSRDVPSVVRYLVGPMIESTARESMERTLVSMRAHFTTAVRQDRSETPRASSPAR